MKKSVKILNSSDLIITVFDDSHELEKEDQMVLDLIKNKQAIILLNKTDLNKKMVDYNKLKENSKHVIKFSVKNEYGINELYSKYSSSGRVYCYGDADCNEIKGVISCCKFFIGARTHASIAAYSKCIPTIVTGYSTKSRGIATDLLGDYKDFVIPVQELSTEEDLTEAWKWLQHQEQTIRVKLKETIPQYIQRVYDGQKAVLRL